MSIIIRELLAEDIYKQSARLCELFNEFDSVDAAPISLDVLYSTFSERAKSPCIRTFVVLEEDLPNEPKIIGTCTVILESKYIHGGKCSVAHVEDVVVLKDYSSKGIGAKLMKHVIKLAKKHGCYKIKLYCSDSNQKFYKKLGFKVNCSEMERYLT